MSEDDLEFLREQSDILLQLLAPKMKDPKKNEVKYVLVCGFRGLFLGINGEESYFQTQKLPGITHAPVFTDFDSAIAFGVNFLNVGYEYTYTAFPVEVKRGSRHASVLELIHSGLGKIVDDMFTQLPGYTEKYKN